MSVDLVVHLRRSQMLTPQRWASAIRAAGFALVLDVDFDVDDHTGYLPCQLDGVESGFEYFADTVTEEDRAELELPSSCDFAVTFTTHSDFGELASSVIAAAVLAHATGGQLTDPQAGESTPSDRALAWAHEQLAEIEKS